MEVEDILNVYICSRRPDDFLKTVNPKGGRKNFVRTNAQPWFFKSETYIQHTAIVVCRDLPLEPRYYDLLMLAPIKSTKWQDYAKMVMKTEDEPAFEKLVRFKTRGLEIMKQTDINWEELVAKLNPKQRRLLSNDKYFDMKVYLPQIIKYDPDLIEPEFVEDVISAVPPETLAAGLTPKQEAYFRSLYGGKQTSTSSNNDKTDETDEK